MSKTNSCPQAVVDFVNKVPDTAEKANEFYNWVSGATSTPLRARWLTQSKYPAWPVCGAPCLKKCAEANAGKAGYDDIGKACVLECAKACKNPANYDCQDNVEYQRYNRQEYITQYEKDENGNNKKTATGALIVAKDTKGAALLTKNKNLGTTKDNNGKDLPMDIKSTMSYRNNDASIDILRYDPNDATITNSHIDDKLFADTYSQKFKFGRIEGKNQPDGTFREMHTKSKEAWVPDVNITTLLAIANENKPKLSRYSSQTLGEEDAGAAAAKLAELKAGQK